MNKSAQHTPVPVKFVQSVSKECPEIFPLIARARNYFKNAEWAPYVYIPSDVVLESLKFVRQDERDENFGYSAIVTVVASWRQSQGIYRFDESVEKSFKEMSISSKMPTSVFFHLPEWCLYIETPGLKLPRVGYSTPGESVQVNGIFVALDITVRENDPLYPYGKYDLIVGFVYEDDHNAILPLIVTLDYDSTIDESMDRFYKTCRATLDRDVSEGKISAEYGRWWKKGAANWVEIWKQSLAKALPYILYLCSINSEVRDIKGTSKTPRNPQPVRTKKGEKLIPASAPTYWECGYRTGPILRGYHREISEYKGGTHASPRPHLRAAHYQHYRVGPRKINGERVPLEKQGVELKWIAPILVNASTADDLVPTLRTVKGEEENGNHI